jgi:hypothetical protein
LIPQLLHRFRIDPAVPSALFVTTITDVDYASFLGIATVWCRLGRELCFIPRAGWRTGARERYYRWEKGLLQLGYTRLHELGSGVGKCLSQLVVECFGCLALELRAGHDQIDAAGLVGQPVRARSRKRPLDANSVAAPIIGEPKDIASDDNDTRSPWLVSASAVSLNSEARSITSCAIAAKNKVL